MVTEKQVKYIMALWSDIKLWEKSEELRKAYIKKKYNVDSTKELTKDQASEFISDIKVKLTKENLEDENGSPTKPEEKANDDLPF